MSGMESDQNLKGVITDIIFENADSGFKICELETKDDIIIVKGTLPFVQIGETLSLEGMWVTHDVYGEQFSVSSFVKEVPRDPEDLEVFLASGLIEGVGNATARLIVNAFGTDTYDTILNHPEELARLKGITHNKAMKISAAFQEHFQMSDIVMFFNKYGAGTKLAVKAYQKYGGNAVQIIEQNPYVMIDDIPEVGFKTADKIGRTMGLPFDFDSRIYAGILHCLKQGTQYGHVYIPFEMLENECAELLQVERSKIASRIDELDILSKVKIQTDDRGSRIVYLSYMYHCEKYVAERLYGLRSVNCTFEEENFQMSIRQFAGFTGYELDKDQVNAVRTAGENGVTVITGGPGTGKTTIIRALVHFMSSCNKKCLLAAPTGRAAKRMTESCGIQAKTIHRLLEFSGDDTNDDAGLTFKRDENNPVEADVIIIDELSMVDTLLMYHLLKALPDQIQLILVGDKDQLPSVGPGNVLRDIISSALFPTVTLSVIYRQNNESLITWNAHQINMGKMPEFNRKKGDFFMINSTNPQNCAGAVVELCTKRLPEAYGIDPIRDIQVLIPAKKGTSGAINMNILLQEKLNPAERYKKEILMNDTIYREGDRIMQIKNNYRIKWQRKDRMEEEGEGIFNGEMGEISQINEKARELTVIFDDDRYATYNFNELGQLEHCYAITVHKSQGSEFPYCIIPLVGNPSMLMTRNILYTAITRAKKMVIIVGTKEHVRLMAENDRQQLRFTGLKRMLESNVDHADP
ncbi:MAG: ATP-dependent RecD-like DNA helicase [Clostridiales bacterium]|jgi:helicase, recD/traA family|nr:ATP-dependent RecD-like DNA helicase [Clostridiales bacterium]